MKILIVTLHANESVQAIPLAAGNIKAALADSYRQSTSIIEFYPEHSPEQMCTEVLKEQPDLVAFSLYTWSRTKLIEVALCLKQQRPALITVAGGPEASADSQRVLQEGNLDAIICGEGEGVFNTLVTCLDKNRPWKELPGLVCQEQPPAETEQTCYPDLSKLPSPWLTQTLPLTKGCGVLWEVARGCRFNCAFCYDAKGQKGVRPLPEKRLKTELELFSSKQVSQVWVLDSTFNSPPERGKALLHLLLTTAPHIHYHIEAKADFLDEETAELLAQLQCSVQIGLQSANPEVLRPLHRTFKASKMTRSLALLSEAGVTFGLDLIYGLPHDNHQGFMDSLDYALLQQPNQVDIFPLSVLPGTEIYNNLERFGVRAETHPPYSIVHNQSYPEAELLSSRKLANATDIFYNRGRAVGFFLQLCQLAKLSPSQLLSDFSTWLKNQQGSNSESVHCAEKWWPKDILPLQVNFCRVLLQEKKLPACQNLLEDLIHYHYYCAEMILTQNCQPQKLTGAKQSVRWQRNENIHIHRFHHPLEEIETYGGEPLKKVAGLMSKEKEYVIFLRQQEEVMIEALNDDFARLLLQADGRQNFADLRRLHKRVHPDEINFAIDQGLLIPA